MFLVCVYATAGKENPESHTLGENATVTHNLQGQMLLHLTTGLPPVKPTQSIKIKTKSVLNIPTPSNTIAQPALPQEPTVVQNHLLQRFSCVASRSRG